MPIEISDLDDPRLDVYRQLKRSNLTRWSRVFIAEGRKVVERLLSSRCTTDSILVSDKQLHYLPVEELRRNIPVYVVPQTLAEQLVGYNFHAGILGCGVRPANRELEELWAPAAAHSLIVGCSRLTDPDNLGTLIRLCTGFGVSGLLLGPGCADPFSRRTLRVSMGNLLNLPVRETSDLLADLARLQQRGFEGIATMLSDEAIPLRTFQPPARGIVLFGNESDGLAAELAAACQHKVVIPMQSQTDSLNVSVAAGIVLYELTQ